MVWFKVDDGWWRNPKQRRIPKAPVTVSTRVAAAGVWALCGNWSGDNLTDGFVPAEVVQDWDPTEHIAQRLVAAGFWEEAERDGERGYQFHDWEQCNPTKTEWLERQSNRAAAGRRGGLAAARSKREASAVASAVAPAVASATRRASSQVRPQVPVASAVASATASAVANSQQTRTPSRPDPTRPSSSYSSDSTPLALIADALGLNLDEEEDETETRKIYDLIAADPSVKSPAGFIRTIALNGDLAAYQARARAGNNPAAVPVYAGTPHVFQTDGAPRNPRCVHNDCQFPEAHAVHRVTAGATA